VIEITWWEELADALAAAAGPPAKPVTINAITLPATIADPDYVTVADMDKGGTITFKQDCGATVSLSPPSGNLATDLNAAAAATQTIYTAEQNWEKAQATSK
jgi:hypothetical protein